MYGRGVRRWWRGLGGDYMVVMDGTLEVKNGSKSIGNKRMRGNEWEMSGDERKNWEI